jgi:hypothetical protein
MLGSAADGWRPGWDFAGVLQSDVEDGPRAGARGVGLRQSGTWAERVAVAPTWIAELADGVSLAQAAANSAHPTGVVECRCGHRYFRGPAATRSDCALLRPSPINQMPAKNRSVLCRMTV